MKRITAFFLIAALIFGLCALASCSRPAAGSPFSILARPDCPASEIRLWQAEATGVYYLFLPSDADRGNLTVCQACDGVSVNGSPVTAGQTTGIFGEGQQFRLSVGGRESELQVLQSEKLPSVYITTQSGSLDAVHAEKDHKEPAEFTLLSEGTVAVDRAPLAHIKGRGHSTWENSEKKPYNIKFEEKTPILGMGAAKNWALLADATRIAYFAEPLAMALGRQTSLAYTPDSRHADLYINGEYLGMYRISEKAEVGKQRLNIFDLDDANKAANEGKTLSEFRRVCVDAQGKRVNEDLLNPGSRRWYALDGEPEDFTKGYLLEITDEPDEESAFCSAKGQSVSLATPKYASERQVSYIADLYGRAEEALYSEDGYNSRGEYYTEFFDSQSFADAYLLREYMMDFDAGVGSTFFYKPTEKDRFFAGPLWDFEASMPLGVQSFGVDFSEGGQWWANASLHLCGIISVKAVRAKLSSVWSMPGFWAAMYRHEDFREVVRGRWESLSEAFASVPEILSGIKRTIAGSEQMNYARWQVGQTEQDPTARGGWMIAMTNLLLNRKKDLEKGFAEDAAMLYYDPNGGVGAMFHNRILSVGEKAVLKSANDSDQQTLLTTLLSSEDVPFAGVDGLLSPPSGAYAFAGWNTAPDGSGETYQPGDAYLLTRRTNVLYAQWKKK